MSSCKIGAIYNDWDRTLNGNFYERLAEYAYAATRGKNNMYITFVFNITALCDCDGHSMEPVAPDIGVFASLDPVAIDKAVLDMVNRRKKVFKKGEHTLDYGKEIGLGDTEYTLINLSL